VSWLDAEPSLPDSWFQFQAALDFERAAMVELDSLCREWVFK
jgi:hypothetical protein